jgi:hypothetical protein
MESSKNVKRIIAVDIDEVLAQFTPCFVDFHNDTVSSTLLTVDSFYTTAYYKVLGVSKEECGKKV